MHRPPTLPKPGHHPAQPLINLALSMVVPVFVIKRGWRTMGVGLAYLVHLFGLAVAFIGISIVDAIFSGYPFIQDMFEELGRMEPEEALIVFASFFVSAITLEAGFIVLAWLLMPWGASHEPWRRSMNRGLIRLLQLTPFFAASLVVLVLAVYFIEENRTYSYYRSYGSSASNTGWFSYDFAQFLTALCWLIYIPSQLIVMLWAASVHHTAPNWAASSPWPAQCEGCGYPLVMLQRGGSCPECGLAVEDSFDTPRNQPDRRNVFARMFAATFRPYAFGKTIPIHRYDPGHRNAAWVGLGLLAATVPLGLMIIATAGALFMSEFNLDWEDLFSDYDDFAMVFTVLMCTTLVIGILLGLLSTTFLGSFTRMVLGRYALYPAAQALGYQSGFLAFWALGTYPLVAVTMIAWDNYYSSHAYQNTWAPPPIWLQFIPFVFPLYYLSMAVLGLILQARLMSGAKYGNG